MSQTSAGSLGLSLSTLYLQKSSEITRITFDYDSRFLCLSLTAQDLRDSRGRCPGLPVPSNPCGLCGRKAIEECTLRKNL